MSNQEFEGDIHYGDKCKTAKKLQEQKADNKRLREELQKLEDQIKKVEKNTAKECENKE